jgi:hypothetical protein
MPMRSGDLRFSTTSRARRGIVAVSPGSRFSTLNVATASSSRRGAFVSSRCNPPETATGAVSG